MADKKKEQPQPLSESVQMYLVELARLGDEGQPVPLSRLAKELDISPVSANEMCRKLQEQNLVIYQPYKGATLTPEGARRAQYILRRHRLWEVLLVDRLGLAFDEAHDMACQLEHATTDLLADRLDAFLGRPAVNPVGQPIPRSDGTLADVKAVSVAELPVGRRGHVVRQEGEEAASGFLSEQGLRPGAALSVRAVGEGALLVRIEGSDVTLSRDLAAGIWVEPDEPPRDASGCRACR